jgi:NAD(P)-dependent dehydrogenase (short-subunit alcohol dehydrogenase family)
MGEKEVGMDHPTIIITGASRGLGAAIARTAARMGANVALSARTAGALERETQAIRTVGGQAIAIPGDVSLEADCHEIVQQTLQAFGRIDGLVNNGGVIEPIGPIADTPPHEWERSWAVNVLGAVALIRLALPSLRQAGGRVINISSGAASNPIPGWGAYASAKAALDHLTRILAGEEPAVTAIAVRPGLVDTQMQITIRETGKGRMGESNYQRLSGAYQQGKLLPPEEPGKAIACLAMAAPHAWSAEVLAWDDEKVRELVRERGRT